MGNDQTIPRKDDVTQYNERLERVAKASACIGVATIDQSPLAALIDAFILYQLFERYPSVGSKQGSLVSVRTMSTI